MLFERSFFQMTKQEYALWAQQESPRSRGPVNILKANTRNVNGKAIGEMILGLPDGEKIQNDIITHLKDAGLAITEVSENV